MDPFGCTKFERKLEDDEVCGNKEELGSHANDPIQSLTKNDVLEMQFNSEEEANDFYNQYAKVVGFSIRKDTRTMQATKVLSRKWVCSKRCEGMHAFFNERLKRKLKLFEFVRCFDMALYRLRNKEADAEAKTNNSDPCLTTALQPLEKHAATIFTRRLFVMFRNEIIEEALLIFDGRKEEFDHRIYKFSKYTEFGSTWEVSYHPATSIMKCSCKKFEFFGLPCSHMISVMKCEHMTEIPPGCVMHRWTKQARKVGEQHCQAQFSSTLTQETRFGVLCSFFTEMCYYASQTSEGFEEARNAFFTMTCRMKQLCMAKGTNVDEGKSSLPPFGVGDPKVVNTKGNTGGSYMAKPRKPRRCQRCRVVGHTRRTCPQNDHKTGQVGSNLFEEYDDYDPIGTPTPFTPKRPRNNTRPCKIHPVKRRLFVTNVDTSPVQLSKDVNDLRSCDAQVVQNSAFTDADTSLGYGQAEREAN